MTLDFASAHSIWNTLFRGHAQFVLFPAISCLLFSSHGTAQVLAPGAEHYTLQVGPTESPANPNRVHVVKVDRNQKDLGFYVGSPNKRRNFAFKWRTSEIAAIYDSPATGFDVIAATNGTFPRLTEKTVLGPNGDGTGLISLPNTTSDLMVITDAGKPFTLDNPKLDNTVLTLAGGTTVSIDMLNELPAEETLAVYTEQWGPGTGTSTQGIEIIIRNPSFPLRANKAVSGIVSAVRTGVDSVNSPIPVGGLVISARGAKAVALQSAVSVGDRLGVEFEFEDVELNNARFFIAGAGQIITDGVIDTTRWTKDQNLLARNPRTIIGYNNTHIFLITIDGRQPGVSIGMTFQEMADYLLSINLTDAINLDGGGSSTMLIDGAVVNTPSDGSERHIINNVMLVKKSVPPTTNFMDNLTSAGRRGEWQDKFSYNPVVPVLPPAPGGDGYALEVKDRGAGFETAYVGNVTDANYSVEADLYLDYRPEGTRFERNGIFARDNGHAAHNAVNLNGSCYTLDWHSNSGQVRVGKIEEGRFTSLGTAPDVQATGWKTFKISCVGSAITFSMDDAVLVSVTDETFTSGLAGLVHRNNFTDLSLLKGTLAENLEVTPEASSVNDWAIY